MSDQTDKNIKEIPNWEKVNKSETEMWFYSKSELLIHFGYIN